MPSTAWRRIQGPDWLLGESERRVRLHAELGHFILDAVPMEFIPLDAYWGRGTKRNLLCLAGAPLTLTMVGEFRQSNTVFNHRGRATFYAHISMLRDADRDGFGTLMGRYSPNRPVNFNTIVAARRLSNGVLMPPVLDGTETDFIADMPLLSWTDDGAPRRGDIVLVELNLRRRSPAVLSSGFVDIKRMTVLVRKPVT